jgi:Dockerin type I domain
LRKNLGASVLLLVLCLFLAAGFGSRNDSSAAIQNPVPTSGLGGTISIAKPTLVGGDLVVPIVTTNTTDPISGATITLNFDATLLSFKSPDTTGSVLPGPIHCTQPPTLAGVATAVCATLGTSSTTTAGLLMAFVFSSLPAQTGCTDLHLVSLNAPDDGGIARGSYTVNAADQSPQSNGYGPDVTVDTSSAFSGCVVATPTATPSPTNTPTPTPTLAPTATPRPICRGDLNGDGVVNVRDLVLVAAHMGTHIGERRYSARFDLNQDSRINVLDLKIVMARLGTICP